MSKVDNAANPPPWTEATRICTLSKASNGQKGELECVLRVLVCLCMVRHWPFAPSLARHKGRCEEVMLTEAANGDTED
jgi:hypothetical protein